MSRTQQSRQQGRGGAAAHPTAWAHVALVVMVVRDRGAVAAIRIQTAAQLAATAKTVQKRARPNVTAAVRTSTPAYGGTRAFLPLLTVPMPMSSAMDCKDLPHGV
jgi:hypothetical protein